MTYPMKYILFKLAEQTFAVRLQQVISIERLQHITPVRCTTDFIKGVTELRGQTTAIIDLKERLQMAITEETDDTRILIVTFDDMQVGLVIDAATEVKDIQNEYIEAVPQIISGICDSFLSGVAKDENQLILILDLKKILNFEEIKKVLKD